ncbi:MAG: type II toxin-antitoxin system VapC family toxin [Desulfobacteraceae bacterium]|nr:type II toxin-antitoxin system VapC family toxin [Desulfobacteraceae bacterium]
MKLLLDTHILLWAAGDPDRIPHDARNLIDTNDNELFFSAASIWEITIKRGLGRNDFQVDVQQLYDGLLDNGYIELPIQSRHTIAIESLPLIHKDPFDRILIAKSTVEGITLLTSDSVVAQYPGQIHKV